MPSILKKKASLVDLLLGTQLSLLQPAKKISDIILSLFRPSASGKNFEKGCNECREAMSEEYQKFIQKYKKTPEN